MTVCATCSRPIGRSQDYPGGWLCTICHAEVKAIAAADELVNDHPLNDDPAEG